MNYKIWLILIFSLAWLNPALATPANISLNYDSDSQTLKIDVAHVSNNVREHYIRRLVIYKNGLEIKSMTFPRQPTPTGFTQDISLATQPGDLIKVEAFCREGGTAEAHIVIAQPEEGSQTK